MKNTMIPIAEAKRIINEHLPDPTVERRALLNARGLYLAENLIAPEPLPGFDNSAMDGYAVSFKRGQENELPIVLPVIGESKAGFPYHGELKPGTAIRISTGAEVPEGTNRIIKVENTSRDGETVHINEVGEKDEHIRFKGVEVEVGDVIARKHDFLSPPMIAWLSEFGITELNVFRPPATAILTTGAELVEYDQKPQQGQIRNANRILLGLFLNSIGLNPVFTSHIGDSPDDTSTELERASEIAEVIIVNGGVSVGPHDHVKEAAEELGFKRQLWRVAQKPGKPLYFATKGNKLLFGLPGNPVSTAMTAAIYVYPVLMHMMGSSVTGLKSITGYFEKDVFGINPGRAKLYLARIVEIMDNSAILEPAPHQKSHMLSSVTISDGFVIIPGDRKSVLSSEKQEFFLFPWNR